MHHLKEGLKQKALENSPWGTIMLRAVNNFVFFISYFMAFAVCTVLHRRRQASRAEPALCSPASSSVQTPSPFLCFLCCSAPWDGSFGCHTTTLQPHNTVSKGLGEKNPARALGALQDPWPHSLLCAWGESLHHLSSRSVSP